MAKKHRETNSKRDDSAERKRWKWEWVRRNREYREDFKRYGKGLQKALEEYNNKVKAAMEGDYLPSDLGLPQPYYDIYNEMHFKLGLPEGLQNPDNPSTESLNMGVYSPFVYASFSNDMSGERRLVLEDRRDRHKRGLYKPDGSPDWMIRNEHEENIEPLTEENCPHYLIITAKVDPWMQKTPLIEEINQKVKENLEKLLKAQKLVYKKQPIRPRLDEFEKYMKVYDLRHGEKKKSWREIVSKILPDAVDWDSAIRSIRYYHDQAVWWINEGWQML